MRLLFQQTLIWILLFTGIQLNLVHPSSAGTQAIETVERFSVHAISKVLTFDHTNYLQRLEKNSQLFTASGWGHFVDALEESRLLDEVAVNRSSVSLKTVSAVHVNEAHDSNGKPKWNVKARAERTYSNRCIVIKEPFEVFLAIRRSSECSDCGFRIQNLILKAVDEQRGKEEDRTLSPDDSPARERC